MHREEEKEDSVYLREPVDNIPLILVVDDDFTSNRILQALLIQEGYRAETAVDSRSCFKSIEQAVPDLILLDVEFPEESGFDICRQIRENSKATNVPILFISSNSDISAKLKGFEAGGVDYIPKPFHRLEVLARVRTHLRLQQALRNRIELQTLRLNRLKEAQEAILVDPVDTPEAKFSVFFQPLQEAGGDYYDVIKVSENTFDYIVADISGHDLGTFLASSALKMLLHQNSNILITPEEALQEINKTIKTVLKPGDFVAISILRLNRKKGRATIINAGNPAPVFYSAREKRCYPMELQGDLLGIFPDVTFQTVVMDVNRGDRFFLFSDGVVDMHKNVTHGWKEKMNLVSNLYNALNLEDIRSFPAKLASEIALLEKPADDLLVMCLEV